MSVLDNISEYFRIEVEHEYYRAEIPMDVFVEDGSIIKRYGIRIIRQGSILIFFGMEFKMPEFLKEFSTICVSLQSKIEHPRSIAKVINEKEKDGNVLETKHLPLVLKPQNDFFYYVSYSVKGPWEEEKSIWDLTNVIIPIRNFKLEFKSSSKYFEYVIFLKSRLENLKIVEANGLLEFERKESDNLSVLQYVSRSPVSLSSKYKYQINLIEDTKYGKKVILNGLKVPRPTSISKDDPYNTITMYYSV